MLKRPSTRRKSHQNEISLNLVPILDSLVALIAFLLFTMAFMVFVAIDSPFPEIKPEALLQPLLQKPLQLTITLKDSETEIWSPFDRFPAVVVPNRNAMPDYEAIHAALLQVKQKFPTDRQAVIVPNDKTSYETIIAVVDTARLIRKTDPGISGVEGTALFSDIVFGNLISEPNKPEVKPAEVPGSSR